MPDQSPYPTSNNPAEGINNPVSESPTEIRVMPERFLARGEAKRSSRKRWWIYLVVLIVVAGLIGAGILLLNRMVVNNNNGTVSNLNNAPINQNSNGNTNLNANNSNDNTNSAATIKELADTLLSKADLGEGYEAYQELKITTDTGSIAGVALSRAQRIFTLEDTKSNSVSITIKVMEAPSKTDANTVFQSENSQLKRSVGNQEGRFVKASTVGDQSLLYEQTDGNKIETIFSWKYLIADISIDVFKGSAPSTEDLKSWLARLLQNFKAYDSTKPITNTNENANINANTNTNANINQNTNGNISAPPPTSSADQDQDSLTDTEELLYKTDVAKPDTDGDSYLDGPEVATGYSPIAASGAKLEASGLVKVFSSQLYNYRILYPSPWIVQNAVADGSSVVMNSDTSEFVSVTIGENSERLSAKQWYMNQAPGIDESKITSVVVGELTGVKSSDGLNVYLSNDTAIYILTYSLANHETANFLTTFEMMVRSFRVTGPAPSINGNTNVNTNSNIYSNSNVNSNANAGINVNENVNVNTNSPDGTSRGPSGTAVPAPILNTELGI